MKKPLYVQRKLLNTEGLIQWAKDNGIKPMDPKDMHVTIAYSTDKVDWSSIEPLLKPILVATKKGRSVGLLGTALVLKFASDKLSKRWQYYRDLGASWDYPEYVCHISLSYDPQRLDLSSIKPYSGQLVFGPEMIEDLDNDR